MPLTNPRIKVEIEEIVNKEYGRTRRLYFSTAKLLEPVVLMGIETDLNGETSHVAVPLSVYELEEFILTKGNTDFVLFDPLEKTAPGMVAEIFASKKNDKVKLVLKENQVIVTVFEEKHQESVQVSFEDFENCVLTIIQFKKLYGEWHYYEAGQGDPVEDLIIAGIEDRFGLKYSKKKTKPTDSSGAGKFKPEG